MTDRPDDDAPPQVRDLAAACHAAVHNALRVELDFTQDTLPLLDHYLATAKGPRDEILGLVAPMCGAYFGEVVRRGLGPAAWRVVEDDYPAFELRFASGLVVRPIRLALEAILGDEIDASPALEVPAAQREAVERALAVFGDVREADYYRLSVRYEALEQATLALAAARRGQA